MSFSLNDVVTFRHAPDSQPWIVESLRLDGSAVDIRNLNRTKRLHDVPVDDLELK